MRHIFRCSKCNKYTMKEVCGCGSRTIAPKPLKYSPGGKLGSYRRKAKISEYIGRGML
ncbi:ribosome biogenesis protein [Candidatus Woesearchaeota archaeon]|nr:ribosome biogenesis protein [Candidatus Woesearchaeota archaeon]